MTEKHTDKERFDNQTGEPEVSHILLSQRGRNGIIWHLETASSFAKQLTYQAAVPLVNVPNEIFNQWDDWVDEEQPQRYCEPVFSREEQVAMWNYNAILNDVLDEVPEDWPNLSELITSPHWERLRAAAERTLEIFQRRGLFDQDIEQF
jgi:hypothetical protein